MIQMLSAVTQQALQTAQQFQQGVTDNMARLAEAGEAREQAIVDLLSRANTSEGGVYIHNHMRKLQ